MILEIVEAATSAASEVADGPPPLYISIDEAAELVSVDAKTVGRWSREDVTFPVLRRGRVVRVHRERYLAWLERQMPRRAARRAQEAADTA